MSDNRQVYVTIFRNILVGVGIFALLAFAVKNYNPSTESIAAAKAPILESRSVIQPTTSLPKTAPESRGGSWITQADADKAHRVADEYRLNEMDIEDHAIQQCYYLGGQDLASRCFDRIVGNKFGSSQDDSAIAVQVPRHDGKGTATVRVIRP